MNRQQGGVLADKGGSVDAEDNELEANTKSGVTLRNGCDAVRIACNRIRDGRDAGVHALQVGSGLGLGLGSGFSFGFGLRLGSGLG